MYPYITGNGIFSRVLILESISAFHNFYLVQFGKRQMTKRKYGLHWYESSKREKEEVCH